MAHWWELRDDKLASIAKLSIFRQPKQENAMKRVVLFGKSLVMSTVGASLQGWPDIQVTPVDPSMPDVQDHLRYAPAGCRHS